MGSQRGQGVGEGGLSSFLNRIRLKKNIKNNLTKADSPNSILVQIKDRGKFSVAAAALLSGEEITGPWGPLDFICRICFFFTLVITVNFSIIITRLKAHIIFPLAVF